MALSLSDLRRFADGIGLKYFIGPNQNLLLVHVGGVFGSFQVVLFSDLDGKFLQFRSINLLTCPQGHPRLPAVLRVLATINNQKRQVKFGWNEENGEIAAYADTWIMDGKLTDLQFQHMLHFFIYALDICFARIRACMETGTDPGDPDPSKPGSLSDKLREAQGKKPADDGQGDSGPVVESL